MYVPTYIAAANGLWQDDAFAHAPIILAVSLWLLWQQREKIRSSATQPGNAASWTVFVGGLFVYWIGRHFNLSSAEFASQPIVLAGALLLAKGRAALRAAWFAIFYLAFMVPLPGVLIDFLTGPLKQWISAIVVELLFYLGYPITRTGVLISIGSYQLLVADACAGLNSMFSLSALGVLYMYIVDRKSRWHNAIIIASILPIAFAVNILRVLVLVIITYHLGDEAGQGFLHNASGVFLLLSAVGFLMAMDAAMCRGNRQVNIQ